MRPTEGLQVSHSHITMGLKNSEGEEEVELRAATVGEKVLPYLERFAKRELSLETDEDPAITEEQVHRVDLLKIIIEDRVHH